MYSFNALNFVSGNLLLKIDLIGYKNQGESIIIRLEDDNGLAFCGVIDCFKLGSLNKTVETLQAEKVDTLNFLIWTHPDKDHTAGLDSLIETYLPDNVDCFAIPEGFTVKEMAQLVDNGDYKTFKNIYALIENHLDALGEKFITVNHATRLPALELQTEIGVPFTFEIECFAPLSHLTKRYNIDCLRRFAANGISWQEKTNIFSIGFIIKLGNRKLCFTGDIINDTLRHIHQGKVLRYFKDLDFLKIPHHGGESSSDLLTMLAACSKTSRKAVKYAGVTVFSPQQLPNKTVLKKYATYSEKVYCTNNLNGDNNNDFGIFSLEIPLDTALPIETFCTGNAAEVIP